MAQAKSIGNVGRRGSKSLVPEPQESSESQHFFWAGPARPKHRVYMGRRLTTLDEPQQFED